jgi:nucleotide-binding universal stress UspA family protein
VTGRIVVGVDGSAGSRSALEWAAEEARTRKARLDVVHVWNYPWVVVAAGAAAAGVGEEEYEAGGRDVLERSIADVRPALEGVDVHPRLGSGDAAEVLLQAAAGADLVVVGSRGHGGFTALLLGSVGLHCAQHAPCPVVIVPSEPALAGA